MKIIIISPEQTLPNEQVHINNMFYDGLLHFHLRKPDFSADQMKKYLQEIEPKFHERIILHSNHYLIDEMGLGGLHFTSAHRKLVKPGSFYDFRHDLHEKKKTLSASFHAGDDFSQSFLFDYAFYSPVANCISKNKSAVESVQLMKDLAAMKTDVIALGGMCPETIKILNTDLFTGVAVLGWIWDKGNDPVKQFNSLKEVCHATVLM